MIINPVIFKGEQSIGTTPGAPLSTDANNQVTSGINSLEASSTTTITAPVTTDALMTGMTLTPVAGTYQVWFSSDVTAGVAGITISVSIYVAGVQKADSLRKIIPLPGGLLSGSGRAIAATQGKVTVNGSQAIEIWWSTSSSGPQTVARTMNLLQVG